MGQKNQKIRPINCLRSKKLKYLTYKIKNKFNKIKIKLKMEVFGKALSFFLFL